MLTVRTDPDHSVANIKSLIHDQEGIPSSFQRLVFNSKELHEKARIHDLGIQHESTLTLVLHLRGGMEVIIVTDSGTTYTIPATRTDVLSDIRKRLIQCHNFNSTGWGFVHDGRLLEEEMATTLGEYKLGEVTLLTLQQKKTFQVGVKTIEGPTGMLTLTGKETILELRGTLADLLEVPMKRIKIVSLGIILRDINTVSYYEIGEGSVIFAAILRQLE
jgi:hypothetical protein